MKSIQFRKNPVGIRILRESVQRKRINWDKILYLLILVGILGFGGRYLFKKYAYINGEGQVLFEKVNIQLTSNIRVLDYYHKEEDNIKAGDSLFTYKIDEERKEDQSLAAIQIEIKSLQEWIRREKLETNTNIHGKEIEKVGTEKLLTEYKKDEARIRKEVYLDVYSADKLTPYIKASYEMESKIQILEKEIELLKVHMDSLNYMETNPKEFIYNPKPQTTEETKVFLAPASGKIIKLLKKEHEVAMSSEPIMSFIAPSKPPYIQAFFKQKDLKYLAEGNLVTVTFPDGSKSEGIIKKFYAETTSLPREFQSEFERGNIRITADIIPGRQEEFGKWRLFHQMTVAITKRRF